MKKEYTKPTARKVVFNYEKVAAKSGDPCYWGSYYEGRFCHETYQATNGISLAAIPDCGWVQEREG